MADHGDMDAGRFTRRRRSPTLSLAFAACVSVAAACASVPGAPGTLPGAPGPALSRPTPRAGPTPRAEPSEARARVVRAAHAAVGAPYRWGGRTPSGFDCSGLVLHSYAHAGVSGLPHSSSELARLAEPVPVGALEPGDLLFFELTGKKTSHVGIYVGERSFVHAPSSGGRVERVSFDHVYWGPRIQRAGRLFRPQRARIP